MRTTVNQMIERLPRVRRAKVEARAADLIAEEMTLRDMRKAMAMTQSRMATLLGVGQDSVSRLEARSDLLLSTVKGYVEAMGGRIRLIAEFPHRPSVDLQTLRGAKASGAPSVRRQRAPAKSMRRAPARRRKTAK